MSAISVRLARSPCSVASDGTLGSGCRQAPEITDGMIPTEAVALERARIFLDGNQQRRVPVSGSWAAAEPLEPRQLVLVLDTERGPYVAKVVGLAYAVTLTGEAGSRTITADCGITLERLADALDE